MLSGIGADTAIPEACHIAAEADPDATFLIEDGRRYSYRYVEDEAGRIAAGLQERGVTAGDRVALAATNRLEWIVSWLAVTRLGAVVVTLNVAYREREFVYMLNQSGAKILLCVERDAGFEFRPFVESIRAQIGGVEAVFFIGDHPTEAGEPPASDDDWAALRGSSAAPAITAAAQEPAMILYTSGTTGLPKGAVLTHRSLLSAARAQAEHVDLSSADVALGQMPMTHVGGTTCTVLASMVCGGQVALIPKFSPTVAVDAIADLGITVLIGVPTMYALTLAHARFAEIDTSAVRVCIVGGSNVEPALGKRIIAAFGNARLANIYGLSETSGGCIMSARGEELEALTTTLGVPIADFEVRIDATGDGSPAEPGVDGELLVQGRCVAAGYWDNPEATASTFTPDGWLRTGDMALIRDDGRVVLRGRKKEMYVRGGYNVYPAEIENVIAQDPGVTACAVVGIPDPLHGEVGVAFVVPADRGGVTTEAILARCREQLAAYKLPSRVEITDELPLTPSGKVRKPDLREMAQSRTQA